MIFQGMDVFGLYLVSKELKNWREFSVAGPFTAIDGRGEESLADEELRVVNDQYLIDHLVEAWKIND